MSTALGGAPAPAAAARAGAPLAATWSGPPQAQIGRDLVLELHLGADGRVAGGQIQIGYDPTVLAPAANAGQVNVPGTLDLDVGSANAAVQVAFRVIAKAPLVSPLVTQIRAAGIALRDAEGNLLPATPFAPYAVNIVP